MKGKAITKIVICSIVAVLLTGILLAGVLGIEVFRALPGIREFKEETGRFLSISINMTMKTATTSAARSWTVW